MLSNRYNIFGIYEVLCMDYQIINDISSFWNTLVIPISMGILTIIFTLWIMGRYKREYLIDKIIYKHDSSDYVLSNGLYIPKGKTKVALLKEKLRQRFGLSDTNPILLFFVIVLLMYGFYSIILKIFLPNMVIWTPNRLFASGIDDILIADLWKLFPESNDLTQLYYFIDKNADYNQNMILLHSIEAYLRLFVCITIVTLIFSNRKKKSNIARKESKKRFLLAIPILLLLLSLTYFAQIQEYNKITRYKCYEVNYKFKNESNLSSTEDDYLEKIKEEKKRCEDNFYFGAYHIRIRSFEYVDSLIKEIIRFST